MNRSRLAALALWGALCLSLTACGGNAPAAEESADPAQTLPPSPAASAAPSEAPAASQTPSPAESVPAESPEASQAPSPTPSPAETAPAEDEICALPLASAAPAEDELPVDCQSLTAQGVYEAVYAAAGGAAAMDASFALDAYYNLSADDLEDFVLYQPELSASIEEIFIARAKGGRVETVKAACESRRKGMAEDAAFYPSTGAYVDGSQLVVDGDWVLFCVCENAAAAAQAFRDCTK